MVVLLFWQIPRKLFPMDGIEYLLPIQFFMGAWPMNSNNNSLHFIKNSIFQDFTAVSWHSDRHFPQNHSLRHSVLQAICKNKLNDIEDLLK